VLLCQIHITRCYYKIRIGEWFGIGFVFPNASLKGGIMQYATSIDKVEEMTGIDFFWGLDDMNEKVVEFKIND
jgi:hypothetical protein